MSKNLTTNSSPTKLKETILEEEEEEEEEEIFVETNNDDYEKEANNTNGINMIDNGIKKDANNINNTNNVDTHNAIKQRLLKMEAETKKITLMQNKYENLIKNKNNVNNENDNIDNENDEIIEIYSNSSNNNYIESNEDGQLPSPSHKSKTSNSTGGATNSNPNVIKSTETIDENNMADYPSVEDQKILDERSIFINNLHTDTTASELQQLFATCGTIERITIVCDKWTGKPKGCSYIQFKSKESIDNAMILNGREVKGKIISVEQKRTNLPKWMRGRGRSRGRVMTGRGRVGGRAYFMPPFYGPPPMMPMCHSYGYFRGRGYRSRGFWQPY